MSTNDKECLSCINSRKSIFYSISSKEKEILKAKHVCSFYKKGEIIFHQGQEPKGLICLVKGKVKVFSKGINDREQIIRMVKPIGLIGYRAVFAHEKHRGTAVVLEDATVVGIEKDSLFDTIRMNGELGLKFAQLISKELGFSNQRTISLTQKHIRARIAESLLFLKDIYGFEKDKQTLNIYLTREEIASLSNMNTSNAIRTLSSFSKDNIIRIEGRKIVLLDLLELDMISNSGQ